MNTIGIIGAMEEEVAILKEKMSEITILEKAGMEFFKGILGGQQVVVVRSGIGKVNAGICTQILSDVFQVNAVINTGIAGSLKAEINIGDIVLSTDTMQHDVDAREFGYEIGQVPRMDTRTFPADDRLRETALQVCRKVNPEIQVFEGRVASGDQFVADKETKEKIIANTQAYCTEMEGAAIGQAAYLNGIPYLVIRAISDKADDSAHMDYPAFEKEAIRHTVNLVENMMKAL
ncbi:5'-methylthioadenosine/adenosylhomocysteine nucleosidase [Blautia sp.]|uniref:5'-methylthioadenosine/adenosylhomocysteine nucleosidase n=1 Tax=Blautia sp. TaxID=1955243 RepID=UPI0026258823|nr:5'-methylthioadenosine/adenosylhomocysteine nucleosidase [Blautia sp.]